MSEIPEGQELSVESLQAKLEGAAQDIRIISSLLRPIESGLKVHRWEWSQVFSHLISTLALNLEELAGRLE